jgi:hypothetical protein
LPHTVAATALIQELTRMNPQKKFHLVFSVVMGSMMVFLMTFVITTVNVGWGPRFVQSWGKAFGVAYVVALPVIYFLAPVARRLTARLLGLPV